MPKLKPKDIKDKVERVLISESKRSGSYLTAYQILEKLPKDIKNRLIEERGMPGLKAGESFAAASVVSMAAEKLIRNIEIAFIETSSLYMRITLASNTVFIIKPGNPDVGLYRLKK